MSNEDVQEWAERVWRMGMAMKLDSEHRQLVDEMIERVLDDHEQAAVLIAALIQLGNIN